MPGLASGIEVPMDTATSEDVAPAGYVYVFVAGFRHRYTGKYISAAAHGKKAFRLLVKCK